MGYFVYFYEMMSYNDKKLLQINLNPKKRNERNLRSKGHTRFDL